MKIKLYPVIGSLALAVVTIACSDYLNESSGDLLIPERWKNFSPFSTVKDILTHIRMMWNGWI